MTTSVQIYNVQMKKWKSKKKCIFILGKCLTQDIVDTTLAEEKLML